MKIAYTTHYSLLEYRDATCTGECSGCGKDTFTRRGDDYYMVHDDVWVDEAGLPPGIMRYMVNGRYIHVGCLLCVTCLERRLGRKITVDDLIDAPCNKALRARLLAQVAA